MSKVMVVEDDVALREIYSIRITAEGYEVVPAGDGEEALAVAVREKPDLILSDVMMPKISGFDMLDILRNTPETASIKVIMMTALSAEDQRERGERLGADRYLVKSQVGIEDVVSAIHDVLGDRSASTGSNATPVSAPRTVVPTQPAAPAPAPAPMPTPAPAPIDPAIPTASASGVVPPIAPAALQSTQSQPVQPQPQQYPQYQQPQPQVNYGTPTPGQQ